MKQNILVIVADQLSQCAVGAHGNTDVQTPHIDALAESGIRFDLAYTPYPLCCPARAAMWTGRLPHATGVVSNGVEWPIEQIPPDMPTLGSLFAKQGYRCVHFGKTHDAGALGGFDCVPDEQADVQGSDAWPVHYDTRFDEHVTRQCVDYLERACDEPRLTISDLRNPHDICNWIGDFAGPHKDITGPALLPELPDNFEVSDWGNLPKPIQYLCCSHNRLAQAVGWTDQNYRHYLAAYYHYTQRVDACIGRILAAVRDSGDANNTLIVFCSDHGDGMGAHRIVTKQVSFYEESARVPFIFAGPGIAKPGRRDSEALVPLCDLLPTICDYAGITSPDDIYGKSLLPSLQDPASAFKPRDHVVSEWVTEWGYTIEPGRMLRSARYKYIRYLESDGEQLYDLFNDPGEQVNLAHIPEYAEVLAQRRDDLHRHLQSTRDDFFQLPTKADPQWRLHEPGYSHHVGPAAPAWHRSQRG